ncbi:hypothetical protein DMENIID0001_049360 [Sergentomyia squamirostris]
MISHEQKYVKVKTAFANTLENHQDFCEIKEIFKDDISRRRLELISSPQDLLNILEAQGLIGENTVTGFRKISTGINDDALIYLTQKFLKEVANASGNFPLNVNRYSQQQKTLKEEISDQEDNKKSKEEEFIISRSKRDKIFDLIVGEIGRKWMDFGRGAGFKQGAIDAIESSHPRNQSAQIYTMLEQLEHNTPTREMYNLILNGLEKCRRNDIREKVQDMIFK